MSKLNNSNTDKFEIVFSNIPVPADRTDALDMAIFDNYVRNVALPDYNIEILPSEFMNQTMRSPISRANNDLAPLTIEFQADEDLDNYVAFFEWIKQLRCGEPLKGEDTLKGSVIASIDILLNDNQNRKGHRVSIKNAIIVNLSSLNMAFGQSEQTIFNVTLQYEDFSVVRSTTTRNN